MNEEETYIQISRYTDGKTIYGFIKSELPFEEVMKLYRLLENDINQPIIINQEIPKISEESIELLKRRWS